MMESEGPLITVIMCCRGLTERLRSLQKRDAAFCWGGEVEGMGRVFMHLCVKRWILWTTW